MNTGTAIIDTFYRWISPPPPAGHEYDPRELHRMRVSQTFPLVIIVGAVTGIFVDDGMINHILQLFLAWVVSPTILMLLCHHRKTNVATFVYISSVFLCTVSEIIFNKTTTHPELLAMPLLVICAASILINTSSGWLMLAIHALLLFIKQYYYEGISLSHCLNNLTPLFACTGIVTIGIQTMHTAFRQADRSLEVVRLSQRMATLVDTVQDALIVVDATGEVRFVNQAFSRMFASRYSPYTVAETMNLITDDYQSLRPIDFLRFDEPQSLTPVFCRTSGRHQVVVTSMQTVPISTHENGKREVLITFSNITEMYREQRRAQLLQSLAHACARAADMTTVARLALDSLRETIHLHHAAIIHCGDKKRPPALLSEHTDIIDGFSTYWGTSFATIQEGSLESGDHMIVRSMTQGQYYQSYVGPGEMYLAVCVPLIYDETVLGALTLVYDDLQLRLNQEIEQTLLLAIGDEIGASLHRAHLYEDARRLALYDSLTNLRNHRALQDALHADLANCATHLLPLSVIMLDIDHFRQFNETLGHNRGDQALRQVARLIESCCPTDSTAARYGGEEFTIILPGYTERQANDLAERLRQTIEGEAQILDDALQPRTITISCGHATFPIHASAATSLLKAADLALYAAKRGGRNRVVAYSQSLLEHNGQSSAGPAIISSSQSISLPSGADLDMVRSYITAIDLRDGYTAAHSDGVSRYAVMLGQLLNLPTEHIEALRLGGLIHDIGKIGVPDQVLRKPGKLDSDEWRIMQAHTTMGFDILQHVEALRHLLPLVRWHHERLDGSGYPDGLKGEDIPQLVRILSVADVFEAFTAERPYHPGRPAIAGLELLHEEVERGRMDAHIVAMMEYLLRTQGLLDGHRELSPERMVA